MTENHDLLVTILFFRKFLLIVLLFTGNWMCRFSEKKVMLDCLFNLSVYYKLFKFLVLLPFLKTAIIDS